MYKGRSCRDKVNQSVLMVPFSTNFKLRKERERRKTHDSEKGEKSDVKDQKAPNTIKKEERERRERGAKRIAVLAYYLPSLDLEENPFNNALRNPLPLPGFDILKEVATDMVDNLGWKRILSLLALEGFDESKLISPKTSPSKPGK